MILKMKFATVATKNTGYFEAMIESAKRNGIDVDVLGMGEKWYGYRMKIDKLSEYIDKQKSGEVVCFFDAYDVIFCDNSSGIERKYLDTGKDIIIGCHEKPGYIIDFFMKNIFKYEDEKVLKDTKYKYLCSGTIIGKSECIKTVLKNYTDEYLDDQVFWYDMYRKLSYPKIELDIKNEFFYTSCPPRNIYRFIRNLSDYDDIKINGGRVQNIHTGTTPMMVHGPGDADMSHILSGLEIKKEQDPEHNKRLLTKINAYTANLEKKQFLICFGVLFLLSSLLYQRKYVIFALLFLSVLFL